MIYYTPFRLNLFVTIQIFLKLMRLDKRQKIVYNEQCKICLNLRRVL